MNTKVLYNEKYRRVHNDPIGTGAYGSVFLVENISNKKRFYFV